MSFEEKYNHYRKTGRFSPPEGYVDDIASRVSEKISARRSVPGIRIWSFSLSAAAVFTIGYFLYPALFPAKTERPSMAQTGTAGESLARLSVPLPEHLLFQKEDTEAFAVMAGKPETPQAVTLNDLSREDVMEYLLDEGYYGDI